MDQSVGASDEYFFLISKSTIILIFRGSERTVGREREREREREKSVCVCVC